MGPSSHFFTSLVSLPFLSLAMQDVFAVQSTQGVTSSDNDDAPTWSSMRGRGRCKNSYPTLTASPYAIRHVRVHTPAFPALTCLYSFPRVDTRHPPPSSRPKPRPLNSLKKSVTAPRKNASPQRRPPSLLGSLTIFLLLLGQLRANVCCIYACAGTTALAERRSPRGGHHHRRACRSAASDARGSPEGARDGGTRQGRSGARCVQSPRTSFIISCIPASGGVFGCRSFFFFCLPRRLLPTTCSTNQTRGSGVTGNAFDAVTQLRAEVGETTDAAVAEGQKDVQAVANAGASYLGQAKDLASSAISTAAVGLRSVFPWGFELCAYCLMQSYLPTSLTGARGTTGSSPKPAQGAPGENTAPGGVPASRKLESGSHTVGNPYPASDVDAQQVAVNESK